MTDTFYRRSRVLYQKLALWNGSYRWCCWSGLCCCLIGGGSLFIICFCLRLDRMVAMVERQAFRLVDLVYWWFCSLAQLPAQIVTATRLPAFIIFITSSPNWGVVFGVWGERAQRWLGAAGGYVFSLSEIMKIVMLNDDCLVFLFCP